MLFRSEVRQQRSWVGGRRSCAGIDVDMQPLEDEGDGTELPRTIWLVEEDEGVAAVLLMVLVWPEVAGDGVTMVEHGGGVG